MRSLDGALEFKPCAQLNDPAITFREGCCNAYTTSALTVPLVSKQHWAEASTTFFTSNTFGLDQASVFREFVSSNPAFVARVRRLIIQATRSSFHSSWGSALNSALLGHFTSLKGVSLAVPVSGFESLHFLGLQDVMKDGRWKDIKMPEVIRAFQQHQLDAKLTTVNLVITSYYRQGETLNEKPEARAFTANIRDLLLEHHPRRVSRRGQE